MSRPTPAELGWTSLVLAAGAVPVLSVYDALWPGLVVIAAAVLPGVLLALAARVGVSRWVALTVVVSAILALALLTGAGGDLSTREALADGIARLSSTATPVPASWSLVAPLIAGAGLVSVLVALRPAAGRVAAPVGAFALYLAAATLTGGRADREGLVAAVLVVLVLAGWWSRRGTHLPRPRAVRAARLGLGLVAVGLVGTVSAVGATRGVEGFEARTVVEAPETTAVQASPLSQVAAWNADPARALLQVRGARYALRLVALTSYDGSSWRGGGRYDQLGDQGEPSLPLGPQRIEVTSRVRIASLQAAWLPTPGRVSGLRGLSALADPETGALLADRTPTEGQTYTVTAQVEVTSPEALAAATVPRGAAAQRYLRTPGLPSEMAAYAEAVTRTAVTPYERALALEAAVRGNRETRADAPSGNSYSRLLAFLFGEPTTFGGRVGTSEQFAAAFAVLGRHVGLPTRIVVGFRPGSPDPGDDGDSTVRGEDALAWPEVYFTDIGWVPFSPTPGAGRLGGPQVDRTPLGNAPTPSASASTDPVATASTPPVPETAAPAAAEPREAPLDPRAVGGLAVLALLAAVLLTLLGARTSRSRGHRRAGAVGAWAEVRDLALLSGGPLDPRVPAREAGLDLARRWQVPEAASLARAAERAAFAPAEASGAGPSTDLWPEVVAVRRGARGQAGLRRRLLWHLDPRPLRRR